MSLEQRIESVLCSERMGASTIRRDKHTVVLYNCESITSMQIEHILRHHKRLSAEIVSRRDGFIVVFVEDDVHDFLSTSDFFSMLVSCITLVFTFSFLV